MRAELKQAVADAAAEAALEEVVTFANPFDAMVRRAFRPKAEGRFATWQPTSSRIKVLAPYFSGSQESLIQVLRMDQRPKGTSGLLPDKATIVSGSASKLTPAMFRDAALAAPMTTVIPNDFLMRGALSYLAGNRALTLPPEKELAGFLTSSKFAILHEANTVFGSAPIRLLRPTPPKKREPRQVGTAQVGTAQVGTAQVGNAPVEPDKSKYHHVLLLPFPMSISRLQVEQQARFKSVLPQTDFIERRLPIRDTSDLDVIPPYDVDAAASISAQSLRTIFTTINQSKVSYVGIIATDSRDAVYLNRLLDIECSKVRVFTTEPSIAFLHPEDAFYLRGVVIASTYPLAEITEQWTQYDCAPRRRIAFPTQSSQGYFNAIAAMFGRDELMVGYHAPVEAQMGKNGEAREKAQEEAKADPGKLNHPPIWISVVGANGRLVPVHCYVDFENDGNIDVPSIIRSRATSVRRPRFYVPWGILIGYAVSILVLLWVMKCLGRWLWRNAFRHVDSSPKPGHDPRRHRAGLWLWMWRSMMAAGLAFVVLPYAIPIRELSSTCIEFTPGWDHSNFALAGSIAIVVLCGLALFAVCAAAIEVGVVRQVRRFEAEPSTVVGIVLLALTLLLVAGVLVRSLCGSPTERLFLYVRSVDLGAATSPLLTMTLLGTSMAALAWGNIRQTKLADRWLPSLPFQPPVWGVLAAKKHELRDLMPRGFATGTRAVG